ncbi:hypothetical protein J7I84_07765 [Arthrobacter sp. ISL-85]|uniref:hypothetical protein n=1 Tax=Arthrobacter sp. ISL-85 TaxID=2819115 RepID=UPI001BEB6977|nr:hypothetical protein [Arthrobacter sp. ISL-85]MBT2566386.1 hypothetical protein [Arthrobacter sp. ISL-85]
MRALETTRAAYGLCQMSFPAPFFRLAIGHQPDARVRVVMRILGARHLLQALIIRAAPTSGALHVGGGVVDSLHSASMVALAIADRRRRRAAALDAVIAGLFAGMEFAAASRRKKPIPPREPRWRR